MKILETRTDILNVWNSERKLNKNKWISLTLGFKSYIIKIKSFNTWIQVIAIEDTVMDTLITDSSVMELSVKTASEWMNQFIKSTILE